MPTLDGGSVTTALGSTPNIKTELPGPKAKAAIQRDHRVTSTSYTRDFPLVVERAKGCAVEDVDGNVFLDFAAGIAVCATGHAHPAVVDAIQKQAAKLIHICGSDFYFESMIRLCEKLSEIAPGDAPKRVFLTNSGTETVEAAIKLARRATGRKWLIAFYGAFHGRTMGSLSLTSSKVRQKQGFGPLLPMVAHAPYGDIGALRGLFQREADPQEVAAIFVETMQGESGYNLPPKTFLKELRALCDEHGILLVCDEIQSGMGRTGRWFACDHYDVVPDVVCVAKGIASGMPIGALIARRDIMDWPPGAHGSTFGGNPLSCAAALATIELVEGGYMEAADRLGGVLRDRLSEICERQPSVGEVRGLGLMTGVTAYDARRQPSNELRDAITRQAFSRGLILLGCGDTSLRFAPPLCITEDELNTGLDLFEQAVKAAAAK
ncbi:MAG: acetyl ornithine aminotransferase family protein [Phycisphaerae bacterium]